MAHEYGWKGALTGAISGIGIVLGIILILEWTRAFVRNIRWCEKSKSSSNVRERNY